MARERRHAATSSAGSIGSAPAPPQDLGLLLLAVGVAAHASGQALVNQRPFRSGVEITSVTATVRDGAGRLVSDLSREAFDVYEDGELQTVTQFTHDRVPIGLGVLLDVSDSMY